MKNMLKKYINIMDKGLFLLDAPTGFGKTTAVIDYIEEYLNDDISTTKRIFFITNLKKNLPVADLIEKIGIEKFNDNCLFLKPYWENIIEKWESVSITNAVILKSEEYLNLNFDINNIRKIKDSISEDNKLEYNSLIKSFESKIERDSEPKFRELVKKTLFINKLSGEKKKNLKDNEWLDKLYPTTNIEKYKVIFASTNKFFSPLDCFYKVPFHIYNDLLINDSIVFIDEFDDTKKVLLDSIIDDGLKISVDIIKLFLNIYFALQHIKIPKVLHKLSKENQEKHEKYPNLKKAEQILNINKEKFEEIYNKHKLDFLIKTKNVKEDKAFLFSDGNYLTITKNSTKKHLITELDEKESNQILIEAVEKKYERNLLSIMIEDIEKTLNHFIVGATWIAQNYKDYKNSIKTKESNYYTIEESIRSILSVFNIGEEYYEYLTEMVSIENSEGKLYSSDIDEYNLFIKHGLSVLEVEDSDYHDMQSTVHLFKFNITPEELLIRICKKSKVIGISATATLDTVLGNFDLKHLKKSLKDKFYEIENEDIKKLEVAFGEHQEIYKNREISLTAKVIDDFPILNDIDKCKELIKEIFSTEQLKDKYTNYINIAENIYYFLIVLKIAYCYYNFMKSSTMKSFICFINSFPAKKINNNLFDKLYRDDIEEILNDISSNCITYILKSSDFDDEIDKINSNLLKLKKCFVITTYQTVGTGKNIQYEIPKNIDQDLSINDPSYKKKDYDGIYLLTPTNLVQSIAYNSFDKMKDLAKFIFQQEYLYQNRMLPYYVMKSNIVSAFRTIFFNTFSPISRKNNDLNIHTAKIIIQAVGRICRTKNKNKEIKIFLDSEILERLKEIEEFLRHRLLNEEFKNILNLELTNINLPLEELSKINKFTYGQITKNAWRVRDSKEKNLEWQKIREYVLKSPTSNFIREEYIGFYFKFDFKVASYSYAFGNMHDFKSLKPNQTYLSNQVSDIDADLNILLQIEEIKECFMENRYATRFEKGEYIMSQSLYKQVYLGALGEVCGKTIFEKQFAIELENIDDYEMYEFFDYKYKDIYIDFKHWTNYITDNDKYVKKFMNKLIKLGGKKCLIVNIIKRGQGKDIIRNVSGNVIQIPWLIDDNELDKKQIQKIEEVLA